MAKSPKEVKNTRLLLPIAAAFLAVIVALLLWWGLSRSGDRQSEGGAAAQPVVTRQGPGDSQRIPDDPKFSNQWFLNQASDCDIDAPEAWGTTTGSSDIVIAVIDSGVDWDHEDLAGNIWTNRNEIEGNGVDDDGNGYIDDVHGWDFVDDDNDPDDGFTGHGTAMAGIIAAEGNNLIGIAGVTWSCEIMPIRVTDDDGLATYSDLASAISYAYLNGANIINISLGGRKSSNLHMIALQNAYNAGAVIIAPTGNGGENTMRYPAAYDNVLSVMGTNRRDTPYRGGNLPFGVDVAAPADGLYTTYRGDLYATVDGTSAAAAIVSGVAGLVWSANSQLSNEEVMQILRQGVDPIPLEWWDLYLNAGRINAEKALDRTDADLEDLAVIKLKTFPEKPLREQTVTVKITVQNKGNDTASTIDVKLNVDGEQEGATQVIGSLAIGEVKNLDFSWTTPDADATYAVEGEVEILNVEQAPFTTNNTKEISVVVNNTTVSDVWLTAMSTSDPSTTSSPMTLKFTVQNLGTQTETNISVKAYINDVQVDQTKTITSLAIGASEEKTFSWTIPDPPSALPYVFRAEIVSLPGEENKQDNVGQYVFSVYDPTTEKMKEQ